MLCGFDDDLADQITATGQVRGLLTQIHPALQRVIGPRLDTLRCWSSCSTTRRRPHYGPLARNDSQPESSSSHASWAVTSPPRSSPHSASTVGLRNVPAPRLRLAFEVLLERSTRKARGRCLLIKRRLTCSRMKIPWQPHLQHRRVRRAARQQLPSQTIF